MPTHARGDRPALLSSRRCPVFAALVVGLLAVLLLDGAHAGEDEARRPGRFAIIFNMGYAADALPRDPKSFETLVRGLRRAHFNTVLCRYEDWRAKICRRHGMQIFVDLLAPGHHVYKEVDGARALCERLRGNDVVYAYHLWSDSIGGSYAGRSRDVANVHMWDPTHPAYVGTYRMSRVGRVEGLDLFGYYDFHWKRGGHWGHLAKASSLARSRGVPFLRYCDAAPGRVGAGNPNRVGYTIATSIPFGLKGYLFHYGGVVVDPATGKLDALGEDLRRVNARFAAIGDELMAIGLPTAVYSTPITTTAKDRPTGAEPAVPDGLKPVPDEHWFRITAGEVLLGLFQDGEGRDVVVLASHNAYRPQEVTLELAARPKSAHVLDRRRRRWVRAKSSGTRIVVPVEEYAAELLRVER